MEGVRSTRLMELLSGSYFPANEDPSAGGRGPGQESAVARMTQGAAANEVTGDSEFLGHI